MVTRAVVVFGVATQSASRDGDWVLLSFYCVSKLSTGSAALSLSSVVTDWGPHPDVAPSAGPKRGAASVTLPDRGNIQS